MEGGTMKRDTEGDTHRGSKRRIFGAMPESKAKSMEVAISQNHDKGLVRTRASI